MDFPITDFESAVRPGASRPVSGSLTDSFADLLSPDNFADAPEHPAARDIYEELDSLASRDDDFSEDADADDDAPREDDTAEHDDGDDVDQQETHSDGADLFLAAGNAGQAGPATGREMTSVVDLLAGNNPTDPTAATTSMTGSIKESAASTTPQAQIAAVQSGTANAAAGAASLAEVRILNKRAGAIQANAQHAEAAKSQLAKAASAPTEAVARTADTAKAAVAAGETGPAKHDAGRLDQMFRAVFQQTQATPTVATVTNPAAGQPNLAAQNAPSADALSLANTADNGAEPNTHAQNAADRTSHVAATKTTAIRTPFNLPGSRPAEQVSVQIQNAARNGNDKISIRLTPASLGKVEVKLELAPDKTVQAIVTADKPETLDMLERDARTLQRALEEAGLKTNSDSLSFERRDPNGAADRGTESDDTGGHTGGDTDTAGHDDGLEDVEIALSNRRHHDGLLDVEV